MEIYSSYEVRIEGNPNITTRIADSKCLLEDFLDKLMIFEHKLENLCKGIITKPVVVGLDVEFDSMNSTKAAILQLCFGTLCVIIQLHHIEIGKIQCYLNNFFADQDIVFVGVDIRNKMEKLETAYMLKCSKNVIELSTLAERVRRTCKYFNSKLEELAREIVGIEIKKPNSLNLASWAARDLTIEQIEYATITAYASCSIGNKLFAEGRNN